MKANEFNHGLAIVSKGEFKDDKYGIINLKNEAVVPFQYHLIKRMNRYYLLLKNNAVTAYDVAAGSIAAKPLKLYYDGYLSCTGNFVLANDASGKKTLFDKDLEPLWQPQFQDQWIASDELGILAVKSNGLWGYADAKGNTLAPCEYDNVGRFENGVAKLTKNGAVGYMNEAGKMVIPFQFTDGNSFNTGVTTVKYKGEWIAIRLKTPAELKKEETLIAQKKLPDAEACYQAVLKETNYVAANPSTASTTTASKPFHFTNAPTGPCAPKVFDDEALPVAKDILKTVENSSKIRTLAAESGSGGISTTFFSPQDPGTIMVVVFTTSPCNIMEIWDVSGYSSLSKNLVKGKPTIEAGSAFMNTPFVKQMQQKGFNVYATKIANNKVVKGRSLKYQVEVSGDGKNKANGVSLIFVSYSN